MHSGRAAASCACSVVRRWRTDAPCSLGLSNPRLQVSLLRLLYLLPGSPQPEDSSDFGIALGLERTSCAPTTPLQFPKKRSRELFPIIITKRRIKSFEVCAQVRVIFRKSILYLHGKILPQHGNQEDRFWDLVGYTTSSRLA